MKKFKNSVAEAILSVIGTDCGLDAVQIADMFEYPPDPTLGDLAFPCFKLSRALHKAPPAIAAELAGALSDKLPEVGQVTPAGGYLNFFISNAFCENRLVEICTAGADYGKLSEGIGKTVVLDYSSPNVAKPFHIGHLGTTVIGHSLKMLHEFAGYHCIGVNHLGDWGTQFGKLIVAYRNWGKPEDIESGGIDALVALYVKFHEEAEKTPELNDKARAEFTKLEHGDEDNLKLWRKFIDISLKEYEKTYKQLGISFDSYAGESFYTDKMPEVVQMLKDKNLLKLDDGASIVDLSAYNMAPCLILKRDGSTLYPTRDIAAALYRWRTYHFDKNIYVTSAGQSLHFAQWFKVVELMGLEFADKLVHVPYGTVSIGGEKLATRTGNVVLLRDLFKQSVDKAREIIAEKNPTLENRDEVAEAVGVGAIVFHYLSNSRIKDINFVLEDALSFDGDTGPYAQYTYARTCSLIEKNSPVFGAPKFTIAEETALLKILTLFPERVEAALAEYEPMIITRYILDICGAFNRFYHACPIAGTNDTDVKFTRLKLTEAVRDVLGSALKLICIKPTEKI